MLFRSAMFRSFDLWFKCFKKLVTAIIPNPDELDEGDNVFIQLNWEEHFRSTLRVYEKKHPFPGLLINYDDGAIVANDLDDDDDRDPNQLSQMLMILMPLLICELLIIVIQGVFSSRGKLQRLSQFYIMDSVTSMLFTMSMNVILHKVLLILLIVIHLMLPLLIDKYIPEVTTVIRLVLLYLSGLHKSQNILLSFTNMLRKIRN